MTQIHEFADTALPIIDEMMENPEAALKMGVLNLIDFAILLSMRGYKQGGLPTVQEQRERYRKLKAYINELKEPAQRTINQRGRLQIFAVEYTSELLKDAIAALERDTKEGDTHEHDAIAAQA